MNIPAHKSTTKGYPVVNRCADQGSVFNASPESLDPVGYDDVENVRITPRITCGLDGRAPCALPFGSPGEGNQARRVTVRAVRFMPLLSAACRIRALRLTHRRLVRASCPVTRPAFGSRLRK